MYLIKYLHVPTWAKGWYFGSRHNDQLVNFDKDLQKNEVKAWVHWIPQRILGGWRDTITDLPRNQALLGIICGSRGASGHGGPKKRWSTRQWTDQLHRLRSQPICFEASQMVACEAQTHFRSSLLSLPTEGEKRRPEMRLRFAGYPNGMARSIWSILLSIKFPWYQ